MLKFKMKYIIYVETIDLYKWLIRDCSDKALFI